MDTAMHAAAVPDADRAALKRPEVAARELADAVAEALPGGRGRRSLVGQAPGAGIQGQA